MKKSRYGHPMYYGLGHPVVCLLVWSRNRTKVASHGRTSLSSASRPRVVNKQSWAIKRTKFHEINSFVIGPGADPGVHACCHVSLQVTMNHPLGGRLPLLSARPAVTFPAAEHHRPLAGTKLYCLVTEAHRCEQLAQGCYAAFAPSRIWTNDLLIASPTLYPLHHRATQISHLGISPRMAFQGYATGRPRTNQN